MLCSNKNKLGYRRNSADRRSLRCSRSFNCYKLKALICDFLLVSNTAYIVSWTVCQMSCSSEVIKLLLWRGVHLSYEFRSIFNHFDVNVKAAEFDRITQTTVITPFNVMQGHRFWYQSKAHMLLSIM